VAFQLSQSCNERPSRIYDIHDPVQAFCFDRAVVLFGEALQAELEAVNENTASATKAKRQRILRKWIPEASAGSFRDPAKMMEL
jgi:hypothetical protein